MKKLKSDVTIYVLAAEKSKDAQIDSMLERYKDLSGHIRVKYVNPKSKPYFYKVQGLLLKLLLKQEAVYVRKL